MNEPLNQDALRQALGDARKASSADQMVADADQSASNADQVSSDADHMASDRDQTGADGDQQASDLDQATADRDRAAHGGLSSEDETAYERARKSREGASFERLGNRIRRQATARDRDEAATDRDRMAEIRDEGGRGRDAHAADLALPSSEREAERLHELEELRAQAADDRARAAADRATAANERARLEAELQAAHLDELTGAYGREMGRLTLTHEIERVRRSGGPLVVAFLDVDELKTVNDRDGHAAGDRVLQSVVQAMRARLRSFDPIIRYGGDEFVCGLGGTDLAEAERRFDLIGLAIEADAGVGVSVGLAELEPGETADGLTERADAAMLGVKAARRARL